MASTVDLNFTVTLLLAMTRLGASCPRRPTVENAIRVQWAFLWSSHTPFIFSIGPVNRLSAICRFNRNFALTSSRSEATSHTAHTPVTPVCPNSVDAALGLAVTMLHRYCLLLVEGLAQLSNSNRAHTHSSLACLLANAAFAKSLDAMAPILPIMPFTISVCDTSIKITRPHYAYRKSLALTTTSGLMQITPAKLLPVVTMGPGGPQCESTVLRWNAWNYSGA